MKVTAEYIEQGKSKAGGYTRKFVKSIGEKWPLRTGWKQRAIGREIVNGRVVPAFMTPNEFSNDLRWARGVDDELLRFESTWQCTCYRQTDVDGHPGWFAIIRLFPSQKVFWTKLQFNIQHCRNEAYKILKEKLTV